jgi:glycosyltransferase involved in cell wall biosynthesis
MSKLFYLVNVDWYFKLHWLDRAMAAQAGGYEVAVACHFSSKNIQADFESYGFTCIALPLSRTGLNLFKELYTIRHVYQALREIKPDLVHAITIKPNLYGGLCANALGIPCVKSVTGLGAVFSSKKLVFRCLQPFVKMFYRFVGRSGDGAFVFENGSDQKLFNDFGVSRSQALLHIPGAGIDLVKFHSSAAKLDHSSIKVLFASRLLRDKGLDTLISAVELIQSRLKAEQHGPTIELLVAGIFDHEGKDAYTEGEIELLANKGRITWLGRRDDMPELIASADIVALPTRYGEGIPRILIEAGAIGRPVITSNVAGCDELIESRHCGVLVPPGNVNALASELMTLIKDADLRLRYAKNLRLKIEEQYSNEVVIASFLSLYYGLLR